MKNKIIIQTFFILIISLTFLQINYGLTNFQCTSGGSDYIIDTSSTNWIVINDTICENLTIQLTNNLTIIGPSGKLTLKNVTLMPHPLSNGSAGIDVTNESNGMFIYNSRIESGTAYNYFWILNSSFEIDNSNISNVGFSSNKIEEYGLYLENNGIINNSKIKEGMIGLLIASDNILIENTKFINLQHSIIYFFNGNSTIKNIDVSSTNKGFLFENLVNNVELININITNIIENTSAYFEFRGNKNITIKNSNINITTNNIGISLVANPSNIKIYNSSLTGLSSGEIIKINNPTSSIEIYNSTLEKQKINIVLGANITFYNYVKVFVNDTDGTPLDNVAVSLYENYTKTLFDNAITGPLGYTSLMTVIDGVAKSGYDGSKYNISYNPYNVTATATGFENYANLTYLNESKTYFITLTPLVITPSFNINLIDNFNTTEDKFPIIKFNVTGNQDNYSCELFMNDSTNVSSYGINETTLNNTLTIIKANSTLLNISYDYWVNCTANEISNVSEINNLIIVNDNPIITLLSPENGNISKNENVSFTFKFTDSYSENANCSLIINGAINKTNNGTINNTLTSFNIILSEGDYNWNVNCTDLYGSIGTSTLFNLNINLTVPDITPPSDITNIQNFSSENWIYINWTTPGNTDFNHTEILFNNTLNYNSTNDNHNFTGLNQNTKYNFSLRPVDHNNNKGNWTNFTITSLDLTAPTYTNIKTNPNSGTSYNSPQRYQFNVTWNDINLNTVFIEHNFSGVLKNESVSGNSSNTYFFNVTSLGAGSYIWKMIANDTFGNINETPIQTYKVNKSIPSLNLKLNGSASNISIERKSSIWINATSNQNVLILELYKNSLKINYGNSPVFNYTQFNDSGLFNITLKAIGNINYSNKEITYFVNVTDTTPPNNINNIKNETGTNWIYINWTNPEGIDDFNHTEILFNNTLNYNSTNDNHNFTGLNQNTKYNFSLRTTDNYNNSATWTNFLLKTKVINNPPNITLFNPLNNTQINNTLIFYFNYTVIDDFSTILNCTTKVSDLTDSKDYFYNHQVGNNSLFTFNNESIFYYGNNYDWSLNCSDNIYYSVSETLKFSLKDTHPPIVTSVNHFNITNSSVNINWTTNEPSNMTLVVYKELSEVTNSKTSFTSSFNYTVDGLLSNTSYEYNITVCDVYNNCNNSKQGSFTTLQNIVFIPNNISLNYPINNKRIAYNNNVIFNFSVNSSTEIITCNLILDENSSQIMTVNTSQNYYNITLNNLIFSVHNWSVTCNDSTDYWSSETFNFILTNDYDGDGQNALSKGGTDCNDNDATIKYDPNIIDNTIDGIDQDCDGTDGNDVVSIVSSGGGGGVSGSNDIKEKNISVNDSVSKEEEEIVLNESVLNFDENKTFTEEKEIIIETPLVVEENIIAELPSKVDLIDSQELTTTSSNDKKSNSVSSLSSVTNRLDLKKEHILKNDNTIINLTLHNKGIIFYDKVGIFISIPKEIINSTDYLKGDFLVVEKDPEIAFIYFNVSRNEIKNFNFEIINKTVDEEFLNSINYTIKTEFSQDYLDELMRKANETYDAIIINKKVLVYDDKTEFSIDIVPQNEVENVTVYLEIPKCLATKLDEIEFELEEFEVLDDDPLISFTFTSLTSKKTLNFEVLKSIDPDCWEQIKTLPIAEKIGNKIIVKDDKSLFISIGILIFVFFSTIILNFMQKQSKKKDLGILHKIEFGFVEIILILIITLNILDFLKMLNPNLDFAKKILSWSLLGILLYEVRLEKIFYGTERRFETIILIIANFLLFSRVFIDLVFVLYNEIIEKRLDSYVVHLYQIIINFEIAHPGLIVTISTITGFAIIVILSFLDIFKDVKKPSLLEVLHIDGKPKNIGQGIQRFIISMMLYLAFFIIFFNFFMEWLAISVDAALMVLAIIIYGIRFIIKHYQHYHEEHIINKIGNVGEEFWNQFINLFKYKHTIFFGLAGILVLHLMVDIGNFIIPFVFNFEDVLYSSQVGIPHLSLIHILLNLYGPNLISNIVISVNYLLNVSFIIMVLLFPGYIWYDTYKNHLINFRRWVISFFAIALTNFIISPLVKLSSISNADVLGVDLIFKSGVVGDPLTTLLISLAVGIIVFILSYNLVLKTIIKLLGFIPVLIFIITYVIYYVTSWIKNLFPQIVNAFSIGTYTSLFLGFLMSFFLVTITIFYIGSLMYLIKIIYTQWFVKKYAFAHLAKKYNELIKKYCKTHEEKQRIYKMIKYIEYMRKKEVSDLEIEELLSERGVKEELIQDIIYL